MSDLGQLQFVWFVCQHIPITKSLVMSCFASILKILTNALNNTNTNETIGFPLVLCHFMLS